MGFFSDIGDAFKSAGNAVATPLVKAADKVAETGKKVGNFIGDGVSKDGWLTKGVQDYVPFGGGVTAIVHAAAGNKDHAQYAAVKGLSTGVSAVAGAAGSLAGPAGAVLGGAMGSALGTMIEGGFREALPGNSVVQDNISKFTPEGLAISAGVGAAAGLLGGPGAKFFKASPVGKALGFPQIIKSTMTKGSLKEPTKWAVIKGAVGNAFTPNLAAGGSKLEFVGKKLGEKFLPQAVAPRVIGKEVKNQLTPQSGSPGGIAAAGGMMAAAAGGAAAAGWNLGADGKPINSGANEGAPSNLEADESELDEDLDDDDDEEDDYEDYEDDEELDEEEEEEDDYEDDAPNNLGEDKLEPIKSTGSSWLPIAAVCTLVAATAIGIGTQFSGSPSSNSAPEAPGGDGLTRKAPGPAGDDLERSRAELMVKVYNAETKQALGEATLRLRRPNETLNAAASQKTDAAGQSLFKTIPPADDYQVLATMTGYKAAGENVQLRAGECTVVNLYLSPDSTTNVVAEPPKGVDTFGAIAFSLKTGSWGYANGYETRERAEQLARQGCKAEDAKAVVWVKNGYCALVFDDQYYYGVGFSTDQGASAAAAKKLAMDEFGKVSKLATRQVVCISSKDEKPELLQPTR